MAHRPPNTGRPNNNLLAGLSAADFGLLEPHLDTVDLPFHMQLEQPGRDIERVYFPESGVASVVARAPRDREIEVGLIGREGMTGISVVMDNHRSVNATFVQIPGRGVCLKADELRTALGRSISLRLSLLRFAQAFIAQASHTALANGRAKLDERLARWLLMAHDRADGDEVHLTHELLALMLGVRRPGVTTALKALVSRKLIKVKRASITILDRQGLRDAANGTYGVPEAEYQRLVGWPSKSGGVAGSKRRERE